MTANENIRIAKVLKEFNIGLNTLVEFFKHKKIDTEVSPTAKISPEVYSLIEKEFGKEQIIKEQAKKVVTNVKEITETANETIQDEDEGGEEELFIKSTTIVDTKGPKIIGKIDLDKVNKPIEKESKLEPQEVETKEVKPTEVEPTAEKPTEAKSIEDKEEEPVASIKDTPPVIIKTEVVVKPEPTAEPEIITEEPKTIDIVSDASAMPESMSENIDSNSVEHISTNVKKLSGPKISGKIDLSQFEKRKTESSDKTSSTPEMHKPKRERIHKKIEKSDSQKTGNQPSLIKPQPGEKRGDLHKSPNRNRDRFKPVKNEVDEEAIQRQIKETYARMTEGKSKSKGSKYRRDRRDEERKRVLEAQELEEMSNNILKVTEFVTVNDLSVMMNVPVTKVIEACMNLGLMVSINQRLDAEALVLVAEEFGYKIEFVTADIQDSIQEEPDKEGELVPRPPIVTVMGHVDHGKTSLLDYIRKANVIAGEAGGITQHIGAYNVKIANGRRITFLDTPGHEAFTAMRARGAKITDIAIIIVAADDAVMPQTKEAINHAQAAGVPMIFAINKIDKPGANSEKIKEQLANMNLLVEDWGGKYQNQEISAKQGLNVDKLLEKILLEAELLELTANPNKNAVGTIIESSLDKGRGYLATILVQAGTLRVGDFMLSGSYTGKVKAMFNERGQKVDEAGPSTPVSILGLNGAPAAGESFNVLDDEKEAKDIANKREQLIRIQGLKTQKHITLEEIGRRIAIGNFQELNIIVKGDVDGSIEALSDSLIKLSNEEIHVNVIHKAVGAISESDVLLAAASNAIIIGFQVRPSANARKLAEKEEIEIRLYSVIYDAINEVKSGIEGMLAPEEKEEITSTAEVRETFKISKVGTIAGCMVKEGKLTRNAKIRVIRDGIVIFTGVLGSLKRFKDDVKEVASGYDCGLNVDGYNDIKVGDIIEAYVIQEIKRKL